MKGQLNREVLVKMKQTLTGLIILCAKGQKEWD